jgi:hypothetical protein
MRLAKKGNDITKEDIACLLGDHLRTIEQLQHVRDSGRLISPDPKQEARPRLLSAPSSRKDNSANNKRKKPPPSAHPKVNEKPKVSNETMNNSVNGAKNKKIGKNKGSLKSNVVSPVVLNSDSDSTIENSSDCDTPKAILHCASPDAQTYWIQPSTTSYHNEADEAFTSLNTPMLPNQNSDKSKVIGNKNNNQNRTETNSKSILKKCTSDVDLLNQNTTPTTPSNLKKSFSLDEQKLQGTLPTDLVSFISYMLCVCVTNNSTRLNECEC